MRWVELNWLDDGRLLGRIGRSPLAAILDLLAPVLAQQGITLPDPSLPDTLYFAKLAAILRAQPMKLMAYLPPFLVAGSQAPARESPALRTPLAQSPQEPRYALRRDGDLWYLTIDGHQAVLRHEQGICYVAESLSHPGERLKKLNLAAKYSSPKSRGSNGIEVYDPVTGKCAAPSSTEALHELSLADDENEVRTACRERARELKETIDDPSETETAKEEARQELEEIAAHLSKDSRQLRGPAAAATALTSFST